MKEKHEKWMAKVRESTATMNDKVHEQQNLPEITWDPLIILLRQQNSELNQKNLKPNDHFFVRENLHEKKLEFKHLPASLNFLGSLKYFENAAEVFNVTKFIEERYKTLKEEEKITGEDLNKFFKVKNDDTEHSEVEEKPNETNSTTTQQGTGNKEDLNVMASSNEVKSNNKRRNKPKYENRTTSTTTIENKKVNEKQNETPSSDVAQNQNQEENKTNQLEQRVLILEQKLKSVTEQYEQRLQKLEQILVSQQQPKQQTSLQNKSNFQKNVRK